MHENRSGNRKTQYNISVWILLAYTYIIWLRTLVLPQEGFITPMMLLASLGLVLYASAGKLRIGKGFLEWQAAGWAVLAVYITINNSDFFTNLIKRGMIQYYVMIVFMLCTFRSVDWIRTWIKWTKIYALIHAFATVFFYLFQNLYRPFANAAFSGKDLDSVLKQFGYGWMPGICKNVSANGMVLSICFLVFFCSFFFKKRKSLPEWADCAVILFALFLTCKRSPLAACIISIAMVYLAVERSRNSVIKLLKLCGWGILAAIAYVVLAQFIPALWNIVLKSEELATKSNGLLNGRSSLWDLAINMFRESPVFGKGYCAYEAYAEASDLNTTSAHNYYLQVLAELGVVGLLMYIWVFVVGCVSAVRTIIRTTEEWKRNAVGAALAIQIFTIVYSVTATSMMYYYILIPYFLSCAVVRAIAYDNYMKQSQVSQGNGIAAAAT